MAARAAIFDGFVAAHFHGKAAVTLDGETVATIEIQPDEANADVDAYNAVVDQYNAAVEQYNAVAASARDLYDSMSAVPSPRRRPDRRSRPRTLSP